MKKAPLTTKGKQGSEITTKHSHHNSLSAQRERLLKYLKDSPLSTITARHELDVLSPSARIHELRHNYGYNIHTQYLVQKTPEGRPHRVALYVLFKGKFNEGEKS